MPSLSSVQEKDRARGALYGLAIGDALGMPTQMLSRQQITRRWGPLLTGFEAAPPGHPIAAGMPAGAVTDDTEQAVLLARLLLSSSASRVDPRELAAALAAWERGMAARGSLDLLGPSTRRAIDAVLAGTPPEEAGASGDTNGAAMRIAPVGIMVAAGNLTALADAVQEASLVTHNTSVALAGPAPTSAYRGGHGGGVGQRRRVARSDHDSDRGDPHRRPVRIAARAGLLRRGARQYRVDRAAGGRAEQVKRSAGGHAAFPGGQGCRQLARIDAAG